MIPYRHLTLRHAEQLLDPTPRELEPGEVKLHSYYVPSLQGGLYSIDVSQIITPPAERSEEKAIPISGEQQQFYVVGPRFNIPKGCIETVFPAPGDSAEPRILPHVIANDPNLPWERSIKGAGDLKDKRNRVPWIALLAFTAKELRLMQEDLDDLMPSLPKDARKQDEGFSVQMKVSDIGSLSNVYAAISRGEDSEQTENTQVIFLEPSLFLRIFSNGSKYDMSKHKYLSHVRKTATDGMISAGASGYTMSSITISHRVGPIEATEPTATIMHLVSLETIADAPVSIPQRKVALVSLHSWTFNTLPANAFNVSHCLEALGLGVKSFRSSFCEQSNQKPKSVGVDLKAAIQKRQEDGYNVVKYRTVTGEETAAIFRGPLTPTFVTQPLKKDFVMQSNFGTDLQMLDPNLCLMDLTYSAAWQLGKTLAMGDQSFTGALARLRGLIHSQATKRAKKEIHEALGCYVPRDEVVRGTKDLVKWFSILNSNLHKHQKTVTGSARWQQSCDPHEWIDISLQSPHILNRIDRLADEACLEAALSSDGTFYNELNVPNNTDYAHVLSWVIDKIHLRNIPGHYLLPDPSYLPEETLKFFYVDANWTDAMVDGALSLANHWSSEPQKDFVRTAIKNAINAVVRLKDPKTGIRPQMPKYGFLLRSQLLVQFPDLTISAAFKPIATNDDGEKPKAPILIQKKIAPNTMLCLFDCTPPELSALAFTPPPHQQCFSVGSELISDHLKISYKKIYTETQGSSSDRRAGLGSMTFPRSESELFDWESRTMKVEAYAQNILSKVRSQPQDFKDDTATSALLGVQLNEPIYTLDISKIWGSSQGVGPKKNTFQLSVPLRHPEYAPYIKPIPRDPKIEAMTIVRLDPVPPVKCCPKSLAEHLALPATLDTSHRPTFKLDIFTVDHPGFIPTNSPVPQDLIFSIRLLYGQKTRYRLKKIQITIPRASEMKEGQHTNKPAHDTYADDKNNCGDNGDTETSNDPEKHPPLITSSYDPPPPAMLGNLRFNVLKRWSADALTLDVVPRAKCGVELRRATEASFMLARVDMYPWDKEVKSFVQLTHTYFCYDWEWKDGAVIMMGPVMKSNSGRTCCNNRL